MPGAVGEVFGRGGPDEAFGVAAHDDHLAAGQEQLMSGAGNVQVWQFLPAHRPEQRCLRLGGVQDIPYQQQDQQEAMRLHESKDTLFLLLSAPASGK